jgi:SAM-dependent methyltransferase
MFCIKSFLSNYFKSRLLKIIKKGSVCCEIGVWKGGFSKKILDAVKPKELHLIDPWEFMPKYKKRWYGGKVARSQSEMNAMYSNVRKKFMNDNITIHRSTSDKVVMSFKDNYFDFVYIDGDHSYEAVLKDLKDYFPKLKKGGILAGDDFYWGITEGLPVRKAVKEFCNTSNIRYKLIGTQFVFIKT